MKKTLKILMLALLVVPCALVFTACGKGMNVSSFTKYAFDAYNKQVAAETYDTWGDVNLTAKTNSTNVETVKLTYLATAGNEDSKTTKEYTNEQSYSQTVTFVRTGTGKSTVVKLELTTENTNKSYSVKGDDQTLETTETSNKTEVVVYVGKSGDEYVVAKTTKTTSKVGTAEPTTNTVNQKETLTDEAAFQEAVENLSKQYFMDAVADGYETVTPSVSVSSSTLVKGGYAALFDLKYSKNGNKVTADGKVENLAYGGLDSLYNGNVNLVCNAEKLTHFEMNLTTESYNTYGYVETVKIVNGLDVKYETVKLTLPDTTEYRSGSNLLSSLSYGA